MLERYRYITSDRKRYDDERRTGALNSHQNKTEGHINW